MGKKAPKRMGDSGSERIATRAKTAEPPTQHELGARKSASLREISVFKLKPHELQPVDRHADECVRELMQSILSLGLLEPPLVRRMPNGEYVILAGHRRVRAWQLLALDCLVAEKMRVFVIPDLDDSQAIYIINAEYAHRKEYDTLHTANLIGRAYEARRLELGREPAAHDVADVVPWEKTSINAYRRVYEALQDPRLAGLVQRLVRPPIAFLYKVLSIKEFSTQMMVLKAFVEGGESAARKAMKSGNGGRPPGPVVRTERGNGFDLTIRVRPSDPLKRVEAQLQEVEVLRDTLQTKLVGLGRAAEF